VATKKTRKPAPKPKVVKEKEPPMNSRIRKEITRLNKIFVAKSDNEKELLSGLIRRAAFMKVQLDDMEKDLVTNGFVEMFSQSEKTEPYERERPLARLYNTLNKNYQTLMKQLGDFVERTEAGEKDDGFDEFVNS
jgi:hypothetical protein